jgi:hypothetical protein
VGLVVTCHAGSQHPEPADRGVFGWLCDPCWVRVITIVERVLGRKTRWT